MSIPTLVSMMLRQFLTSPRAKDVTLKTDFTELADSNVIGVTVIDGETQKLLGEIHVRIPKG